MAAMVEGKKTTRVDGSLKESEASSRTPLESKLRMVSVKEDPPEEETGRKKVVEVNEDGSFDLEEATVPVGGGGGEEGPTLMDELYADANAALEIKKEKKKAEEKRMKKGFGAGMKKGFFNNEKKKPQKKKKEVPIIRVRKDEKSAMSRMQEEVREGLEAEKPILVRELEKGKWMTDSLLDKIKSNPKLQAGLANPRYQQAIEDMKRDPKKAEEKYGQDAEIGAFLHELAKIMGSHFEKLGLQQKKDEYYANVEKNLGPMALKIAKDFDQGRGPKPAATRSEQDEVDAVLNNDDLRKLLMDPDTQRLMQSCQDPAEFHAAMRDPAKQATIHKLAKAGLVKVA